LSIVWVLTGLAFGSSNWLFFPVMDMLFLFPCNSLVCESPLIAFGSVYLRFYFPALDVKLISNIRSLFPAGVHSSYLESYSEMMD
jgi:hypothetical protein